jgi:hypothetical protein
MGNRDAIDGELRAVGFGEVKEAADVVVLVVGGKKKLRFGWRKPERRKSDGLAELTRKREVEVNELSEGHAGGSASGFGAHGWLRWAVYRREREKKRKRSEEANLKREFYTEGTEDTEFAKKEKSAGLKPASA